MNLGVSIHSATAGEIGMFLFPRFAYSLTEDWSGPCLSYKVL